jgi:hypothetical protein
LEEHVLPSKKQPVMAGTDLAGSLPLFPGVAGTTLATSTALPTLHRKQLLFNRLARPGQIHVYSANCKAGERLRVQSYVPVLPMGGAVMPACAVIAQSLPYSADVQKLPVDLPAGYSAVVAPPPGKLGTPVQDMLTRVQYYPGPLIDTRTLVSGHCYIVVWSPHNQMGKYALQIGSGWSWRWDYWLQLPRFWWQIRGWFGHSRVAAYGVGVGLLVAGLLLLRLLRNRRRGQESS